MHGPGGPKRVSTPVWYTTRSSESRGHVPDCSELGLGVQEISIAADTGADVMATFGPVILYMPLNTYKTWDIPA